MSDSPKPTKTGGLAGVNAGETAICTVGKEGFGLSYRGYTIEDLAAKAGFEEVAYLLLYGHLAHPRAVDRIPLAPRRDARAARRAQDRARTSARRHAPDGRAAHRLLRARLPGTRNRVDPRFRPRGRQPAHRRVPVDAALLVSVHEARQSASKRRPTTPTSPRISCTCSTANPRRNPTSARWTFRSCSTPSTSSTPRRSRCASSRPRWRISTAPSSAASGRCAVRCTAGPTRPRWS